MASLRDYDKANWAQVLGDRQREGVDGDAPVDAQNAPTGACKTAPKPARGFAHRPQPFIVSVAGKPQLLTCRRKANVLARRA
jgi:hypothetical protein